MSAGETIKLYPATSKQAVEASFVPNGKISPVVRRSVEPVGPFFLAHARRQIHGRTFSEDERLEKKDEKKEEVKEESEDEEEDPDMLRADPKEWKQQDHYAVLGLSKYRYKANLEQIKKAHLKKVLKHHPDKKAATGNINDDSFFKCIQKANEILTDATKRRQYDSVDENAEVEAPESTTEENFFELWAPVFDAEARFSKKQPAPGLGTIESPRPEVEKFYNFWYNFDSWRTFEYLDKDIPDDGESRDNKRYQEKKNRSERQKNKARDNTRLRQLVDTALASDPRIKLFKQQEKAAKEARKWERDAGAREAAAAAQKKKEEEERLAAEEASAKATASAQSKKAKEDKKKTQKRDKKIVKNALKDFNYFSETDVPSPTQVDTVLKDTDALMPKLGDGELATFAADISAQNDAGAAAVKGVFDKYAKMFIERGSLKASEVVFFGK
ncbi:ribosome-associated chaperone, zuotin [Schizosaccharomyces osmophilus]|uniref:Ribosome-associated chaperone, zuotin n=1 Tax=Schizosaccharomyces osmophilus TaxID=2545709 RepID=A0AAE9WBW5_9SCHI|nr:ribosome-associated chaperone, zuotin [Schizosaccharomyces osmophilus]WBW72985.1 ribosome-associated chaperone, zuotin [Schizosaccharomyces osmophilus]